MVLQKYPNRECALLTEILHPHNARQKTRTGVCQQKNVALRFEELPAYTKTKPCQLIHCKEKLWFEGNQHNHMQNLIYLQTCSVGDLGDTLPVSVTLFHCLSLCTSHFSSDLYDSLLPILFSIAYSRWQDLVQVRETSVALEDHSQVQAVSLHSWSNNNS